MENNHIIGQIFCWKNGHPKNFIKIKTILIVSKEENAKPIKFDFPPACQEIKIKDHKLNESKAHG